MIGYAAKALMKVRGKQCKAFRKYLGFTQAEVAQEVNQPPNRVSEFERGNYDSRVIYEWYLNKNMLKYDKSLYMWIVEKEKNNET